MDAACRYEGAASAYITSTGTGNMSRPSDAGSFDGVALQLCWHLP